MPSTYSALLRTEMQATGENSGTWGLINNTNIGTLLESSIAGLATVVIPDADYTLTALNGVADEARSMGLNLTGTLTLARNVICPSTTKMYVVKNATVGGFAVTVKTAAGTGVAVASGTWIILFCDGTNVNQVTVSPGGALGTPSSGTLTNCTSLPIATGVSGLAANVATFLATPSSANLAAALTDETGTGSVVFSASPILTGTTQVAALTASGAAALNGGILQNAASQILGGWSGAAPIRTSIGSARTDAYFSADASGPVHQNLKGRGTEASPTVTSSGDVLGTYSFAGYNTANAKGDAAAITCTQDGAATASGVPGKLNFYASDGTTDAIRAVVSATAFTCVSATTASAANVYQSASGAALLRSTSSIRYKQNIEPLQSAFAQKVLDLKPVWYRSKADADRKEWSYYGLIAEEVASVEPRLVHWIHRDTKEVLTDAAVPAMDAIFDESGVEVSPATPEKPAKYTTVPDETSPIIPDGVQYERLSVLLLKVVQEQQAQIAALEARLTAAGL